MPSSRSLSGELVDDEDGLDSRTLEPPTATRLEASVEGFRDVQTGFL